MKKLKLLAVSLMCLMALAACDSEKIITAAELPDAAQSYIQQNYPDVTFTYVKKDVELFKTRYKVRLDNGLEIEFDKDGIPVDIDVDN